MKQSKRLITIFLTASLTASVCMVPAYAGETSPYDVSNMKFDDITIRVSSKYGGTGDNDNFYKERVEEFNALDNGITVEMDNISTESDYLDKLATSFADGDTPNVFVEFGGSRCLDYVEADALVDMTPYLEYDTEWKDSIMDGIWDATQYEGIDGTWGIPFHLYDVCLFYNKEILEKYGRRAKAVGRKSRTLPFV